MKALSGLGLFVIFGVAALAQQPAQKIENQKQEEMPLQFRQSHERAPHTDDYYLDTPEGDRVPDEFFVFRRLNQLRTSDMEGYHLPPLLLEVNVLNANRKVKAGEEVKFSAVLSDPTEITPFSLGFDGPLGRRTDPAWTSARFTRVSENKAGKQMFQGVLKVSKYAPAGKYLPKFVITANSLGHTKAYFADWHPSVKDVWFEVEENKDVDLEAPYLRSFELGPKKATITDPISITVHADDNRSGIGEIVVTIQSPSNKYIDVPLMRAFNNPKVWKAYFRLNPWYEEGEYVVKKAYVNDVAGNVRYYFNSSDDVLKDAQFVVNPNDKADVTSPELIAISFDKEAAKQGDEVKVRALASDDRSGVEHLVVFFISPNLLDKRRIQLRPVPKPPVMIKPAFDVLDNVFEGILKIDPLDETGPWTVTRVVATDYANNYLDISAEESEDLASLKVTFSKTAKGPSTSMTTPAATTAAPAAAGPAPDKGKIRRVDMIPPHPPRGACLNCHEP